LAVLIRSIQINRNPYSRARQGMVEIDTFIFFDAIVRYPAAFCKAINIS
jgi:hypothetical protein